MAKLIGTDPNQVPTNADLGTMAYQDAERPSLGQTNVKSAGTSLIVERTSDAANLQLKADGQNVGHIYGFKNGSGGDLAFYPTNSVGVIEQRMKIHRDGYILKPFQPAFYAYRTTDLSISANTSTTVTFPSININRGSHYNTSNGRFTAPVDGVYFFTVTLQVGSASNNPHAGLEVNGSSVIFLDWNASKAAMISRAIYLTAGDYVNSKIYVTVADTVVNGDRNSFSGFLVG